MVSDLIRDSFFGHAVRLISANRLFTYPEERDPSVAEAYYNHEKTLNLSLYGETNPRKVIQPKNEVKEKGSEPTLPPFKDQPPHGRRTSLSSASTETGALPPPRRQNSSTEDVEPGRNTTVTVVDWSDNDQENPRNWSRVKRYFVTFQICLLTMGVYSGSAIYTPAIPFIEEQFQVSETVAILGLCLFVAGYGLGPMVVAPLSEMPQIGRTPIYIITLAIFVALQVPTALSSNIGMLFGFRFLTGLFGSPVLATGGATLADIYRPQNRYKVTEFQYSQFVTDPQHERNTQVVFEDIEDYKRMKKDPFYKEHLIPDHEVCADTKRSRMTIGCIEEFVTDGEACDGSRFASDS
ncbi:hypothetical protein B9Z65_1398 [Elsinoe australis]|uniref:Uncharacterized protein n=1 Tax=Elsinoe australis TaxID=40998 RepID=A0A2P7YFT2_9PEZI|nr:hypothetical protein B9Z65_1398 [Elsinoe australis]